jgi:ATP-dependent Lon protease
LVKAETVKKITLISGYDDKSQLADIAQKLDDLKQSLLELDIELEVSFNPNMHDREIQIDNGWSSRLDGGSISFNGQKAGSESEQTI